jgi:hypothetical protein
MFKKQTKKLIFAPQIASRFERSDTTWNHYFRADFLNGGNTFLWLMNAKIFVDGANTFLWLMNAKILFLWMVPSNLFMVNECQDPWGWCQVPSYG